MRSPPNEGCFFDSPRIHCATGACTSGACSMTGLNRHGEWRAPKLRTIKANGGTTRNNSQGTGWHKQNKIWLPKKCIQSEKKKNSSLSGLEPRNQEVIARSASHCATGLSCRLSYGEASIPTEMLPRKICCFQVRLPSEAWVRLG